MIIVCVYRLFAIFSRRGQKIVLFSHLQNFRVFYFKNLLIKEEEKEEDSDNENMEEDEEFDKETLEKVGTFVKKSTCYVPRATISLKFNWLL